MPLNECYFFPLQLKLLKQAFNWHISLFLRPDAEKKKQNFDWTFSTDYKGTLGDKVVVEPTDETINFELLKQKDQILFYHDLTLFEDELHDHGISKLSVKIVRNSNFLQIA